jgi:hypothetical protein
MSLSRLTQTAVSRPAGLRPDSWHSDSAVSEAPAQLLDAFVVHSARGSWTHAAASSSTHYGYASFSELMVQDT